MFSLLLRKRQRKRRSYSSSGFYCPAWILLLEQLCHGDTIQSSELDTVESNYREADLEPW